MRSGDMHIRVLLGLVVFVASAVSVSGRAISDRKTLLEILRRYAAEDGRDEDEYVRSNNGVDRRGDKDDAINYEEDAAADGDDDDDDDDDAPLEMRRSRTHRAGREHMSPREFLQLFGYLPKLSPGVEHEPANMVRAIKHFQTMYHIQQTGRLDNMTRKMMTMDRCGMPDVMPPDVRNPNLANKAVLKAIQAERFLLPGHKWKKRDLTYRFKNFWNSPTLSQEIQRRAIARAWKYWSDAAPLTFTETTNKADFTIAFAPPGSDHGDGVQNAFDGPGMVLAHAFYPESGEAHFDSSEQWTDGTSTGINLMTVAAHELGHALGLGHSTVKGALMAPYYQGYDPNLKLPRDDTDGIQQLYGVKDGFRPPEPDTTTTTTTTRLPTTTTRTTTLPTRTPVRPPGPINAPDTCTVAFKAATQAHDYRVYVFSGEWMWRLSDYGMDGGFPALISKYYDSQPPTNINAVIFSWKTYYTYMFKGSEVWKYYGYQLDQRKRIGSSGYAGDPQAALADADGTIFLFKGSKCWIFDEKRIDVSEASSCPFHGMPATGRYDTAVRLVDDPHIYFFQGQVYTKYDMVRQQLVGGYPKPKAGPWMGPTCGSKPNTPK